MFFIDSKSSNQQRTSDDHILFDSLGASSDNAILSSSSSAAVVATPSSSASFSIAANSVSEDGFISVGKAVPPQLAVGDGEKSDPSRKLQHNVDVRSRIYFSADPKSIIASSSKNRVKESGNISKTISSSSSSSSPASKEDLLVASLLDDKSSSGNSRVSDALSKSVITDDFGRREAIPSSKQSRREKKKAHLAEKESSKGAKWFHMKRAEMTEEEKRDLKLLKMRKALDPKTFYKGDDMKGLPRFFQKGTVVESKAEFYSSRIPKKQRKQTLADELLADSKFVEYGSAKMEERKKFDEDRKKRMRQKKHLQRMTAKKKGKK